jgi:lipopolysaccharide export system permease protein
MKGFGETPADFVGQTKKWDFLTTVEMLRFLRVQPQISGELSRRVFQIHWRMAVPWSCLVVTLFGVPAGARGSRQNALVGLFAAMGLFASFYAVAQVGVYLGMRGLTWPWLGAWLANIVFTLAGAWAILETR